MEWDELRGMRDTALLNMDKYQLAIPYSLLTVAKQTELAAYRTLLLDLPNEYDDPKEAMANFPEMPTWMN
jgi:hypothetical protein